MPVDAGIIYSPDVIQTELPEINELERFLEEDIVKFIIGYRPMEEWDSFIEEVYDRGMDRWIAVHTRIYQEQMNSK